MSREKKRIRTGNPRKFGNGVEEKNERTLGMLESECVYPTLFFVARENVPPGFRKRKEPRSLKIGFFGDCSLMDDLRSSGNL